ncbi:MAG: hypothetical protein FIB06_04010 [Betaproteobacteria bacterium]|nr:hypothetical protein [Betaproteobacteria bacterium]
MSKKKVFDVDEGPVRTLRIGVCGTLSGKSSLTYRIGRHEDGTLMMRLAANSNPGYFNDNWIKYEAIRELLDKEHVGITSYVLNVLYQGRSMNSPSFLFAVLKHEGLVKPSAKKRRCYDVCSDTAFLAQVQKLIVEQEAKAAGRKGRAGKNNKGAVADSQLEPSTEAIAEAVTEKPAAKPLFVLTDVPESKAAPTVSKRGRPKKSQPMVAVQGNAENAVEAP